MVTTEPSIAELQENDAQHTVNGVLWEAWPVLLEIAAAAKALQSELQYLIGPRSERLQAALNKVRQ